MLQRYRRRDLPGRSTRRWLPHPRFWDFGHRSILADPRRAEIKTRLDAVKRRESFRPYAPAILEEHATAWFDLDGTSPVSPFMLRAPSVLAHRRADAAAVVHADGTARLQTVSGDGGEFRRLIEAFGALTGVPILLNTSFNSRGQPMVETPEQALALFHSMPLDACVVDGKLHRRI